MYSTCTKEDVYFYLCIKRHRHKLCPNFVDLVEDTSVYLCLLINFLKVGIDAHDPSALEVHYLTPWPGVPPPHLKESTALLE